MSSLLFSIVLGVVGLGAVILEIFVPAAGLIGILGGGCIIGGITLTFINYGTGPGTIYLVSILCISPAVLLFFFKRFPKSFVGKRLILKGPAASPGKITLPPEEDNLLEQQGIVLTDLRPAGRILVNGKRFAAVTRGEYITKDKHVKIIKIEGNRVTVSEIIP